MAEEQISNSEGKIRILVVEDDRIQQKVIQLNLVAKGYLVDCASTGQEAIWSTRNNYPDIMLLDLNLPDMDGLEIIHGIQDLVQSQTVRIIVFSSDVSESKVIECLVSGAMDYVYKRESERMLSARIENVVRNLRLTQELQKNLETIQENIEFAKEIQMRTLPQRENYEHSSLSIFSLFLPLDSVSGDIFDIYKLSNNKFRIFLVDAAGHGIQAGFITISIKTEYDRLKKIHSDLSSILRELLESNSTTFSNESQYSCIIIDLDLESQELHYTSFGHSTQYLFLADKILPLDATNPIIGIDSTNRPLVRRIPLESQFFLLLFTDGVYEFFDTTAKFFGEERFLSLVKILPIEPVGNYNERLLAELRSQNCGCGFRDDITIISISQGLKRM